MSGENYINHIAMVLDESSSMDPHRAQLISVADQQIAHLATRSKELDQETRVTVYTFNQEVRCIFYDKDVLRLPSLRHHYRPSGSTALIDATLKSQDDLALTAQLYGDHAFLTYVLTDGEENASGGGWGTGHLLIPKLRERLGGMPENWTVAVLVPNANGKREAQRYGFPPDNIAIWDATSAEGLTLAGETIRTATDSFMTARASGIRGTRTLFSTGLDAVNTTAIKKAGLKPLPRRAYQLIEVKDGGPIREWVQSQGLEYRRGACFYQLNKTETIQPNKVLAVVEKVTGRVYSGTAARSIVGLGADTVRVKPGFNPQYDVFVQSTSVNRKLISGTRLLVLS